MGLKNEEDYTFYVRDGIYYVRMYDVTKHKRVRLSTGCTQLRKAIDFVKRKIEEDERTQITLAQLIALYKSVDTNPRKIQSTITGALYGDEYAYRVSRIAQKLDSLFIAKIPKVMDKQLINVTKVDAKNMRAIIAEEYGFTRSASEAFSTLKTFFTQAEDDGLVQYSITRNMPGIKYAKGVRKSFQASDIAKLINSRALFKDDLEWAIFTLVATTGMRRSEALALNIEQLQGNCLLIDRAYKNACGDIGLPKRDLVRAIPLSKISMEAINACKPDKDGNLFSKKKRSWYDDVIMHVRMLACGMFPKDVELWRNLVGHELRHTLNTNLILSGCMPSMVAMYMSWSHQDQELLVMQKNYTHFYAKDLQPVADKIDELYT